VNEALGRTAKQSRCTCLSGMIAKDGAVHLQHTHFCNAVAVTFCGLEIGSYLRMPQRISNGTSARRFNTRCKLLLLGVCIQIRWARRQWVFAPIGTSAFAPGRLRRAGAKQDGVLRIHRH